MHPIYLVFSRYCVQLCSDATSPTRYLPQCHVHTVQKLTVLVGDPIDVSGLLKSQVELSSSAVVIRKQITDVVQKKLYDLKSHAEELHKNWTTSLPVAYRTL